MTSTKFTYLLQLFFKKLNNSDQLCNIKLSKVCLLKAIWEEEGQGRKWWISANIFICIKAIEADKQATPTDNFAGADKTFAVFVT